MGGGGEECTIRVLADFHQNHLFSAGHKSTVAIRIAVIPCTGAVPEVQGDEILKFRSENAVDFWWQISCQFSPGKIGLKFVTENFTTFFTSRKDICHLELTLGESSLSDPRCMTNRLDLKSLAIFGHLSPFQVAFSKLLWVCFSELCLTKKF